MLEELSNAFGPSGCEGDVRKIVLDAIREVVDEWRVDHLGNVLAVKRGTGRGAKRMQVQVAAHMDEIGFMVTHADADGMLHFVTVGGIDPRILPTKRVVLGPKKIPGIIISPPVHMVPAAKRKQVTPITELVIDIGAEKKEDAEKTCPKGTYAVFATSFHKLGRGVVCGKAFDDRAGCFMLIELLKRGPYKCDLHAAFTTMEEVGLRGARVVGYDIKPDVAFVLEGTICEDSPKEKDVCSITELGGGPAITLADRGMIVSRKLAQYAVQRAEARGIAYQFKQPGVGGTDASAIQHSGSGIPTLPLSVPVRYIHSPASVMSMKDLRLTVDLAEDLIREISSDVLSK